MKLPSLLTMTMLLGSSLSFHSCVSRPTIADTEQCSIVLAETLETSYCLCRQYRFSEAFVGAPTEEVFQFPVKKCDRLVGWEPETYAKVARFWEAVRFAIQANTRQRSPRGDK